ncbi:MAG: UDP-2,3-diacylglucosamine diphosphatase [Neisseriaceae bacterium]|nr:UDP-2,3-diacylglucosamine diphosphatase [Neisseriaceae bacterium]
MNNITIFMSDMHLCADTPDLNALFFRKLDEWAGKIDALYLLGDIFDVWVGDDDDDPVLIEITQKIKAFAAKTPLFIMRGNRDFLIGKKFAANTGAKILDDDPCLINCYGTPFIVSHGDIFCTDDVEYQQFRRKSRSWLWQFLARLKPLAKRRQVATQIRHISQTKKSQAVQYEIADVTEKGLNDAQNRFSGSLKNPADIIHGHTHRPAIHTHSLNNQPYRRFVLPDWYDDKGGCLIVWSDGEIEHATL